MTLYTILRRGASDDEPWRFYAEAESSSAARAIRSLPDPDEGAYVAIPARSWRPLTVTVETTTRVSVK